MTTFREAWRVLTGRAFWRDFRAYWSPNAIAARLDRFAADLRAFNQRDRRP